MQKGSNSSKKNIAGSNPPPADNYKSETSKVSASGAKGLSLQNMKQFKCEIDHEIAKCLDTLDRQGLKFLKQTLRASKIFGLNTLELGLTQPVEEDIEVDQQSPPKPKEKQPPKKIQPKNNIQIKKVSKPEISKKQPVTKPTKPIESKNDLNEKINKRLEGLNIKTGKKNQVKSQAQLKKEQTTSKQKIESNNVEIAEEIEIEDPEFNEENSPNEPILKANQKQSINPIFYESSKEWIRKENSSELDARQKGEQNQLLKPFCKKQFKKHHEESKHREHKDYGIQISKPEQFRREINDNLSKDEDNQHLIKEQNHESIEEIVKEQYGQQIDIQQEPISPKIQEKQQSDPYIQNLINAISRLSPSKRNKLEKIIQKLENSDKSEVSSSILSNPPKIQPTYQKPYIAQRQSFAKNSEIKENHSKSRSKLEKVQKATSLKSSLVKRIQINNLTPENHGNLTPSMKRKEEDTSSLLNIPKKEQKQSSNILEMYDDVKSQMISQNRKEEMKVQVIEEKAEKSKELQSSVNLSHSQLNSQNESGQKLIKINKKKNQVTNILFKILSNNGHSSLVGLTSIQIFNPQAEIIPIDESNIKQASPKLLKLFSDNVRGEGWFTSLANATICLENITQPVAGIRIINWNKSQLQADRQADMMEISINEQLHWRGQIKGGSYKESEVYATNIKVMQRHFQFPELKLESERSFNEEKPSLKNQSIKNVQLVLEEPLQKREKQDVCWLEKETVEKQLKQLAEEERKDEKFKKIGSIRNTVASKNINEQRIDISEPTLEKIEHRPFDFNWLSNQVPKNKEDFRVEPQIKPSLKSSHADDILGELSKGVDIKRRKEESSISIGKKKQEQSRPKQDTGKKHQQYLLKKQKEQDEQFEKILQSMEQRSKPQDPPKIETPKHREINREKEVQNKGRLVAQKNFEDFMKDSLFDEKPVARKFENKSRQAQITEQKKPAEYSNSKKNINLNQLDNLIDQLNDVVGEAANEETGEEFYIPTLPAGKELGLTLLSNWGNQTFIGLNGLQLFDCEGESIKPIGVSCTCMNSKQLFEKLFKQELLTSDEKIQLKFPKGKKIAMTLSLPEKTEIAAMRIWNYNGHRVHNNIGVKKLHIKLDGIFIFSGEIQQSSGSSEDAYKYCEYILFTENPSILKKIAENDWLSKINRRQEEERLMFKTTLEHFHRPVTRNDEEAVRKQLQDVQIEKQPIKLSKRQCFQYDPPIYPEGFGLKLVLHSSWGDRFFIGLNGIEVFSDKGENITSKNLAQIRADPSSISKLEGYEKDKRVVANLINGKNNTTSDANIWLAPLLSDVQKIEKGRPNVILLQYSKPTRIAGINIYNYIKTPQRGVREIEVFLDNFLLYRGYLRKYEAESGIIHTTINFTKEQSVLQAMNYVGYNEDHLEQEVGLINEQKIIKANAVPLEVNLTRPMTGKPIN